MARNILVVEDDHNISDLIRMYLEKEGFEVRIAYDGGKAVEEYDAKAPDMVLLDIMLPVMDGWAVCAHIREKGKTPIIMLTAKGDVTDRITGLEMGADDYLVKPFEMKELMARINAVLRRSEIPDDTRKRLVYDKLVIDLDSYELVVDGKKVDIASFLVKPGQVITVKERSRDMQNLKDLREQGASKPIPKWLELNADGLTGKIVAMPQRDDIDLTVEEHLIVEFYSR